MMFKSTYLKLTLFYVLIVMAISLSFSMMLYQVSSREINRGLGKQMNVISGLPKIKQAFLTIEDLEQIRAEQIAESTRRLKLNLFYFNLLILVISSYISYLLAKKTLHPIEEAMEAQNRFTADASHELRTPLTAMRTEIEVNLRDKKLTLNEAKKLLSSNLEEIGKLESLSSALLKLARYQEDAALSLKPVSLKEAIAEASEKVDTLAQKKQIELNYHSFSHPELPTSAQAVAATGDSGSNSIKVLGDKQSLVELFVILFDNAIKYSPEKSEINIWSEEENKHVLVRVKDQGVGIKASDLPYIFNRFYRADTSRTKGRVDGYGLGLSIAKSIVELHHGTITATSKPGKGSEFVVKLPLFHETQSLKHVA